MTSPCDCLNPMCSRLVARVVVTESGCWEWQGCRNSFGYGRVSQTVGLKAGDRSGYVHRMMFAIHKEALVKGMHLDHICRNPPCCNPAHLDQVSNLENQLRSPLSYAGRNARKTHCIRGHEFTPANTYVAKDGRRSCRRCNADRMGGRLRKVAEGCASGCACHSVGAVS